MMCLDSFDFLLLSLLWEASLFTLALSGWSHQNESMIWELFSIPQRVGFRWEVLIESAENNTLAIAAKSLEQLAVSLLYRVFLATWGAGP